MRPFTGEEWQGRVHVQCRSSDPSSMSLSSLWRYNSSIESMLSLMWPLFSRYTFKLVWCVRSLRFWRDGTWRQLNHWRRNPELECGFVTSARLRHWRACSCLRSEKAATSIQWAKNQKIDHSDTKQVECYDVQESMNTTHINIAYKHIDQF